MKSHMVHKKLMIGAERDVEQQSTVERKMLKGLCESLRIIEFW